MTFSFARKALAAGVCASLFVGAMPASWAQRMQAEATSAVPLLGLQDAIVRSLQSNPDLKVFGYELEAQLGRVRQAGARPSMELSALVENALGTGARSSFDAAETTISLGFLIEHGARQRRLDAAQAGGQLLDTETTVRRLDVAAEATRRYLAILTAQEELKELNRAVQLAEETLSAVQARVRAAKSPQAEEARAYAQIARLRLEQEHVEHQLITAKQRLSVLWGARQPDFAAVEGALLNLPRLEAYESFAERLERNPQFEALVSERRVREAEVRLAEARRRLPWQVTAGVRRFEDQNDHAFVVGLTVPLPCWPERRRHCDSTCASGASRLQARGPALTTRCRVVRDLSGTAPCLQRIRSVA